MANQLKMALIDTIQRLHQQNWSQRRIARNWDRSGDGIPVSAIGGGAKTSQSGRGAQRFKTSHSAGLSNPPPPGTPADLNDC